MSQTTLNNIQAQHTNNVSANQRGLSGFLKGIKVTLDLPPCLQNSNDFERIATLHKLRMFHRNLRPDHPKYEEGRLLLNKLSAIDELYREKIDSAEQTAYGIFEGEAKKDYKDLYKIYCNERFGQKYVIMGQSKKELRDHVDRRVFMSALVLEAFRVEAEEPKTDDDRVYKAMILALRRIATEGGSADVKAVFSTAFQEIDRDSVDQDKIEKATRVNLLVLNDYAGAGGLGPEIAVAMKTLLEEVATTSLALNATDKLSSRVSSITHLVLSHYLEN